MIELTLGLIAILVFIGVAVIGLAVIAAIFIGLYRGIKDLATAKQSDWGPPSDKH